MLLFLGFNTSARYATIIGKKKKKDAISIKLCFIIIKVTLCHGCSPVNLQHI